MKTTRLIWGLQGFLGFAFMANTGLAQSTEGNGTTNVPPVVNLVNPANGSVFNTPVNLALIAEGYDVDGFVTRVEFFTNNASLGISSNWVVVDPLPSGGPPPGTRAFFLSWTNVPPGGYVLTAKATDNGGASSVSSPVNITVNPGPPPTNVPPVVRITSPANGTVFRAPLDIPIFAYARDADGSVASVQFFENGTNLGYGKPVAMPVLYASPGGGPAPLPIIAGNLFVLVWSNPPAGTYALTAAATDNGGASTTSGPVNIGVLPPLPPPTNRPPIVSIVATDPIAIEGTNCWPWLGLASATPTWRDWLASASLCRFFTNCGPKNALFTVWRFGDTNGPLSVSYGIGGTATNGVDYVTLSGLATIPAGERAALIPLVPLDDGPPDITSTVILTLVPSTNSPPDYLLGFPRRAGALILDRPSWPPPIAVLPDKCFHLSAAGPNGAWFHIEYTTDLLNWTPVCTNQVINGLIDFVDPDAPNDAARFYRAVPELNPPAQ
jgi:hypothetical protein